MKSIYCYTGYLLACTLVLFACAQEKKDCHCTEAYDRQITYYPGDYAWHKDTCWHCHFQGRGVEPGSIDDDVWEFCSTN